VAKRVVSFSLAQGRKDRVDPRLAPFGVVAVAKNLRVRKDGRLACRYGYTALDMRTSGGTMTAYDLIEYQGRLVALGSHSASGFPERPYEYTGLGATNGNVYWRYETDKQELTPFVDLKDITVMSPPSGGADLCDSAAGAGYVLVVTRSLSNVVTAVVVRESDNQPILTEVISSTFSTLNFRCTFAVDTFYVASQKSDNALDIIKFNPTTATAFSTFKGNVSAANATVAVYDIVPVENPTTARIAICRDRGAGVDIFIRIYDSGASQIGSDITVSGTDSTQLSLAVDQTANKIHIAIRSVGGGAILRTYNFAGTLLLGPTTLTSGNSVCACRIPATAAAGAAAQVATAVDTTGGDTVIEYWSEAAHTATASTTIFSALVRTRLIPWTSSTSTNASGKYAVAFGGIVCPDISDTTTNVSNALFFTASGSANAAHLALRDFTRAFKSTAASPSGISRQAGFHLDASTGRVAWCAMRDPGTGSPMPSVTTFTKNSSARRQTAKFGDLLYIAGAPMQVYDGRCLTEPFQELPGILSVTPSNGSGSLTNAAQYDYVLHWEMVLADGSIWKSAPSEPFSTTLGSADDTVTLVTSTPHLLTVMLNATNGYGPDITEVVSRTVWDGSKGSIFRRTASDNVTGVGNDYGQDSTIEDDTSDASLADEEAVYTQADRGAFSGPLEHDAPQAGKFIAATESRLLNAGNLRRSLFQMSKDAFLGEPFTFSEFSPFFSQVSGAIRGVASLDGARLIFTADDIYAFSGDGPDDLGGGAIGRAQDIPTPSGLEDWRSLLKAADGLYFQLDDDKLYRLPRGGGAPEWIGIDVVDTLTTYPVITGTARCRREDTAVFACENAASTDGRLLVRSLRTGIWTEDTAPLTTSQGIEAVVGLGDSLAYVSGGAVYLQSTSSFADGTSTVIPTQIKTQPIYPFDLGGYGTIWELLVTGEYRSAGTLALRVSYDDGVSFTSYDSYTLTGLTVGQTVQRKWAIQQSDFTSLVFEWTYTPSAAGEGFILHTAAMLVETEEGLRELTASEMA